MVHCLYSAPPPPLLLPFPRQGESFVTRDSLSWRMLSTATTHSLAFHGLRFCVVRVSLPVKPVAEPEIEMKQYKKKNIKTKQNKSRRWVGVGWWVRWRWWEGLKNAMHLPAPLSCKWSMVEKFEKLSAAINQARSSNLTSGNECSASIISMRGNCLPRAMDRWCVFYCPQCLFSFLLLSFSLRIHRREISTGWFDSTAEI